MHQSNGYRAQCRRAQAPRPLSPGYSPRRLFGLRPARLAAQRRRPAPDPPAGLTNPLGVHLISVQKVTLRPMSIGAGFALVALASPQVLVALRVSVTSRLARQGASSRGRFQPLALGSSCGRLDTVQHATYCELGRGRAPLSAAVENRAYLAACTCRIGGNVRGGVVFSFPLRTSAMQGYPRRRPMPLTSNGRSPRWITRVCSAVSARFLTAE